MTTWVDQTYEVSHIYKSKIQQLHQAIRVCDPAHTQQKNKLTSLLCDCLFEFGHFLYKKEQYDLAEKYYEQTCQLDPDYISALNQMGMCLTKKKMYRDARNVFLTMVERAPRADDKAHGYLNIAHTYRLQNNQTQAAHYLSQAKQLAPQDSDVLAEEKALIRWIASMACHKPRTNHSAMPLLKSSERMVRRRVPTESITTHQQLKFFKEHKERPTSVPKHVTNDLSFEP